jgi:outer membrane receptor for ferrienterochelin and colicins
MKYIISAIFLLLTINIFAENQTPVKKQTEINIVGHVISNGEHIPFANIVVKGTTIGTSTDETGHYQLVNLPEGELTLRVQVVGYKPQEKTIELSKNQTKEINFDLEEDVLGIDEVVVTGDRNEKNRKDASVIVNTITPKTLTTTSAVTLGEGLNFSPGIRMETDCENCGFTQVRMNGMDGPYSQILINGHPIFSALAGVYGLELIPSNMLERIEVIRGGGSSLYGSNAIAGTINLILKDPIRNTYEFGVNGGLTGVGINGSGDPAQDYSVSANNSLISADGQSGMALFGFYRNRQPFDANGDGFSEKTKLKNTTFGGRVFHRFSSRNKISLDFFNIHGESRGGNMFDYPEDEADIAEAVRHDITTGAVTYEQFFRDEDLWSVYASGQNIDRNSYYGAEQSNQDYGKTKGFTGVFGTQYNARFDQSNLTLGLEDRYETINDKKLGYADYDNATIVDDSIVSIPHTENTVVADQKSNTFGAFAQYEINFEKIQLSVGARFDHYNITDEADADTNGDKNGNVLSPRLTVKYDIQPFLQARVSYSKGYRAPQIYDEDLHVESSGSRQVIHENSDDLKQETSHSFMASLDFNRKIGKTFVGFLAEGFYTQLNDAFCNEIEESDEDNVVTYIRENAENGAVVKGVNFEAKLIPTKQISFKAGMTFQSSKYEDPQDDFNEKKFYRTPDSYGYFTADWDFAKKFSLSATGNYTGKMLVPYYGNTIADPDAGELRESDPFFDLGTKLCYTVNIGGAKVQFSGGMKNIFNSYQDDFDEGIDRDPGYIYGPSNPRTIYFGIKIGNML